MYQIHTAIDLISSTQNEELEAAAEGARGTGNSYANRLREAQALKTSLIDLLGQHVTEHGC